MPWTGPPDRSAGSGRDPGRGLRGLRHRTRRPAVVLLRDLCRRHLAGFTEGIRYGMPAHWRDDVDPGGIAFAAQRQYLSFSVVRIDVVAAHRDRLAGLSVDKGCVRYRRPDGLDVDVVRSILEMTATTTGPGC